MGQFQKVSGEDEEDDESHALVGGGVGVGSEAAKDLGQAARPSTGWFASREEEHWNPSAGLCFGCLTPVEALLLSVAILIFSVVVVALSSLAVNTVARRCLELAGTAALGVKTSVGAVSVGVLNARSTVSELTVASPRGYGGEARVGSPGLPFLDLAEGLFDASLSSFFSSPWELQEIRLQDLRINVEQDYNADSNAKQIITHLSNVTAQSPSDGSAADSEQKSRAAERRGVNAVANKFIVGRLAFRNVSARVCIHPLCDESAPAVYQIKQILVKDVGKKSGGVRLHELLEIVVQAVLIAAIRAAPGQIGYDLHRSVSDNLRRALDYASVHCDLGSGLEEIRHWTSYELSRLGDAAAAVVAPNGGTMGEALQTNLGQFVGSKQERAKAEAELYHDARSVGENLSQALSEFGDAVQSTLEQVNEDGDGKTTEGRGAALERGTESLKKVEQEGLHEAETLAASMFDSLTAEAAAEASAAAGETTPLPTLPPAKSIAEAAREAAALAEEEMEQASGLEKELRASLLSPSPPPLHA